MRKFKKTYIAFLDLQKSFNHNPVEQKAIDEVKYGLTLGLKFRRNDQYAEICR